MLLDAILLALSPLALQLAAGVADSRDDQPMAGDMEVVFLGHSITQFDQFVTLELNQLLATLAIEVIVLWVAIIMFINGSARQLKLAQQSGIHEFVECTVDGGPADVVRLALAREFINEPIGVEVIMLAEDVIDQHTALFCVAHPAALQILFKPFERGERYFNGIERKLLGHDVIGRAKAARRACRCAIRTQGCGGTGVDTKSGPGTRIN